LTEEIICRYIGGKRNKWPVFGRSG